MKSLSLLTSIILLLSVSVGQAATSEVERLKGVIDNVIDAVYGECCAELTVDEKLVKVRSVLESEYDLDVIIRRAIGRNWRLMNAKEQEQVLDLVKQLVIKAYVEGVQGRGRPEIDLGEVIPVSDKRMEIPSIIKLDDSTYYVLYRLGRMESGWQIYDIVAEDISVVSNYRQQIDDHFRKGNGQELIDKLKELLTKEVNHEEIQI